MVKASQRLAATFQNPTRSPGAGASIPRPVPNGRCSRRAGLPGQAYGIESHVGTNKHKPRATKGRLPQVLVASRHAAAPRERETRCLTQPASREEKQLSEQGRPNGQGDGGRQVQMAQQSSAQGMGTGDCERSAEKKPGVQASPHLLVSRSVMALLSTPPRKDPQLG